MPAMRWRGLEPPRPARGTRPSTLRVYQFRHQRAKRIVAIAEFDSVRKPRYRDANRRSTREPRMLSKRQPEIYDFVVSYAARHGYPPTVREIGEEVGLASPSTVHAHLANLERAGLIKRDPTKPRALELTGRAARVPEAGDVHVLPLVGQIAAGGPLLAEQNIDSYLSVPEPLASGGEAVLLRVRGDSMQDARILEGDYAAVRRQQDARNGDIVVALAGDDEATDEATVKRFFRENGRVRLQPENSALDPLYPNHVHILGKVTGVFRTLR